MSSTKYMILWPNGLLGGFEREDVAMCAIAENRGCKGIWQRTEGLALVYEPITKEALEQIAWPKRDSMLMAIERGEA